MASNLRQFIHQGKTVIVNVADQVVTGTGAFRRPVAALDQTVIQQTLQRTEAAIKRPGIVPSDRAARLSKVVLTSMNHTSEEDPTEHATGSLLDEEGTEIGNLHIAATPSQQQPARMHQVLARRTPVQEVAATPAPEWVWDDTYRQYRFWNGSDWVWQEN